MLQFPSCRNERTSKLPFSVLSSISCSHRRPSFALFPFPPFALPTSSSSSTKSPEPLKTRPASSWHHSLYSRLALGFEGFLPTFHSLDD
jgi:hypothetical protein